VVRSCRHRQRNMPEIVVASVVALMLVGVSGAETGLVKAPAETSLLELAPYAGWTHYGVDEGLPSNRVLAIKIDGNRVWAGTDEGLALFENGRWIGFGTADGLPHKVILSLDVSSRTGDLWIGTAGGLARLSAGRFDVFTQMNSGLPNDFVNGVKADPHEDFVWAATAVGAGRLNLSSGEWTIFTHENTPMHEPWTYSITIEGDLVFVGAWGAGVLEYSKSRKRWREYRDPDGQFEVDLFSDDGPVNDVTSGVALARGILWQAAYSGLARYDGREWLSFTVDDSGLASDFVNFVRARDRFAWLATDNGLSLTDGDSWQTYRRLENGRGEVRYYDRGVQVGREVTTTAPSHNYILGVDVSGETIWLATHGGVSRGFRSGSVRRSPFPRVQIPPPDQGMGNPGVRPRFSYARTPEPLLPFKGIEPHRELFKERVKFLGAGREAPEPEGLETVRIGFIGPLDNSELPGRSGSLLAGHKGSLKASLGRQMLRAARLAMEEANAEGGFSGRPFEVVPRSDMVLWGQSSNELVQFVEDDEVWAVLSGIDSNHTHVLSRAAIKLEVLIVSAGVTDPTLVEHSVPWLVRCINDDRQAARVLLQEIFGRRDLRRTAVLRVNDRDGRTGILEFVEGARRLGFPVILEQRFEPGETDFRNQLERIAGSEPGALVIWGDPAEAGEAVRQARAIGVDVPVFGFERMAHPAFLEAAGEAAEGVVVSTATNLDSRSPAWTTFRDAYQVRWQERPGSLAAHAYDGMNLIIEAVRRAGLNRVLIRDSLYEKESFQGASGEIIFDTNMSDVGPTWLATVKDGLFIYQPAPDWSVAPTMGGTGSGSTGQAVGQKRNRGNAYHSSGR
jgi:ABC-type branched-subunit amino acid transport system substrate-binding protein